MVWKIVLGVFLGLAVFSMACTGLCSYMYVKSVPAATACWEEYSMAASNCSLDSAPQFQSCLNDKLRRYNECLMGGKEPKNDDMVRKGCAKKGADYISIQRCIERGGQ